VDRVGATVRASRPAQYPPAVHRTSLAGVIAWVRLPSLPPDADTPLYEANVARAREHPLADRRSRKHFVDQMRGALGRTPPGARWADRATQLLLDEPRHPESVLMRRFRISEEALEVVTHRAVQHRGFTGTRDVTRAEVRSGCSTRWRPICTRARWGAACPQTAPEN
jgi:hypothetical protein